MGGKKVHVGRGAHPLLSEVSEVGAATTYRPCSPLAAAPAQWLDAVAAALARQHRQLGVRASPAVSIRHYSPTNPRPPPNPTPRSMGYLRHALRYVTGGLEPWRGGELKSLGPAPGGRESYPWLAAFVNTLTGGKGPAGALGGSAGAGAGVVHVLLLPLLRRRHVGAASRRHPL